LESAPRIKCPSLLIAAVDDTVCPFEYSKDMASKIEKCKFVTINCGFSVVYSGDFIHIVFEWVTSKLSPVV
jgi:pimeloyl-ACP methyl ester carboxylesterase